MTFTLCESLLFLEERKEIMIEFYKKHDVCLLEIDKKDDLHVFSRQFNRIEGRYYLIYLKNKNIVSCLIENDQIVSKDYFSIVNLNSWGEKDNESLKQFLKKYTDTYKFDYEDDFFNKVKREIIVSISDNISFKEIGPQYVRLIDNNYQMPEMMVFGNLKYLSMCEKALKSGVSFEGLKKTMPLYSHSWDFDNKFDGIIQQFIQCYSGIDICTLNKLYHLNNCGPDGLKTIFGFFQCFTKLDIISINGILECILLILNDFPKLKTKILLEFIIRNLLKRGKGWVLFNESHCNVLNHVFQEIVDVVNMAKQLNIHLTSEIIRNYHLYHDDFSNQIEIIANKEKTDNFKKVCKENSKLLKYLPESNQYTVICPEKPEDLSKEGHDMHNCVASYFNRVVDNTSKIYFMRKKSHIDSSFITVELNSFNEAIQYKRKGNRAVSKKEAKYIKEWVSNIKNNERGMMNESI